MYNFQSGAYKSVRVCIYSGGVELEKLTLSETERPWGNYTRPYVQPWVTQLDKPFAVDSGMVCDGAKSSCAAKIAAAVEAGLVGMEMTRRGSEFRGGDGILEKGVENTIRNVSDLARIGMRETNEEIVRLMIKTV